MGGNRFPMQNPNMRERAKRASAQNIMYFHYAAYMYLRNIRLSQVLRYQPEKHYSSRNISMSCNLQVDFIGQYLWKWFPKFYEILLKC